MLLIVNSQIKIIAQPNKNQSKIHFELLFKMVQRGTTQTANTENCILVKGSAFTCVVEPVAKGNQVSSLKGLEKPLGFNSAYSYSWC